MIVAEIIARLAATTGDAFALIEGAAELAEVQGRPTATPAAYVVPLREVSAESERLTGVLQRCEVDVAVVIIADNLSDERGAAAAADIDALKGTVRAALLGWRPASATDPITHVSGELTRAREGAVWWEDVFATALYLTDEET